MGTTELSVAVDGADGGIARLQSRARNAGYAIYAVVIISAIVLAFKLLELAGIVNLLSPVFGPLEQIYAVVLIAHSVIFLISVVFVCMWIYRAHANLRERGIEMETSPGWAVGWFFVPVMNLFKPFQNMRELWSESHLESDAYGAPAPGEIGSWWACWIIGNMLSYVSMRLSAFDTGDTFSVAIAIGAVGSGLTIACALLLRNIIRDITSAQNTELNVRQVFE